MMEPGSLHMADLMTGIVVLILVAALTAIFSARFKKLPLTIGLVLAGITIGELGRHSPAADFIEHFQLTPELVLFVFLPTLIFESAHSLDYRQLQRNLLPVLVLAIPGLLLSTAIIGGIFYALTSFDLLVALLLGAILSATDPVAVIALFKQLGVPERLTVLVEGESLFNDATSLVLASLLLAIALSGEFYGSDVVTGSGRFLLVFFGGIVVGGVLAVVVCAALGRIESSPEVEISLTTILAYLSFLIAEHGFHVSGIMAVVAAGLTVGSYGKSKISPSTAQYMEHFWEYAAWLANALIFLLVGLQINLGELWQVVDLIAIVVMAMLVSRAVVIFTLVPAVGKLPGCDPVSRAFQAVMYWGGLRGAIALAIVLSLPQTEFRETLIAVVMGAVLFTLIVQGLSIEALVTRLGLNKPDLADHIAQLEGALRAKQSSLEQLSRLRDGGYFSARIATRLAQRAEQQIAALEAQISGQCGQLDEGQQLRVLVMRVLVREKSRFDELFRAGLVGEAAYRELSHNVGVQLEEARHYSRLPNSELHLPLDRRLWRRALHSLEKHPLVSLWVHPQQHREMALDYEMAWARYRGTSSVLEDLAAIAQDSGVGETATMKVRSLYQGLRTFMADTLADFGQSFPEFAEAVQERLGKRLLLLAEQESVEHAAKLGTLPAGIAKTIRQQQARAMQELKRTDLSLYLHISVDELLTKVPLFEGLQREQFQILSGYLRERSFSDGDVIIRQGDRGDSLFMIARGMADVRDETGAEVVDLKRLFAGDFFGEAALLHGTRRNATVLAATPCTTYELHRSEWRALCTRHPDIALAVSKVDQSRTNS